MEFNDDQDTYYRGSERPIFGAIFMANRRTKKECLKRKLFGLPPPQANFVKKLKSGMMLFLFEHEERQLYGVFQALSDGAMNIVPHAFMSSGKQFPAQIRIKPIWHCKPLPERDFRPAIRENYYAGNKFNFALSKHQVSELLLLFESRKIKTQTSKTLFSRDKVIVRPMSSDFGRVGYEDDRPMSCDFGGVRHEDDRHMSSDIGRVGHDDDDKYIPSDIGNNELVNLNRDPGLSKSNLNISSVPESSIFGGQFGSPYETSNSARHGDTSIGLNVSDSPQAYPAYSLSSEDCLFPTRRRQAIPFDINEVKPEPPPMTFGSTNVTSSFEDYIPLDSQSHIRSISSSVQPSSNSSYLEPEPYSSGFPSLWRAGFGREKVSPPCSPVKDPPYVPDHHYPAALGHLCFGREKERSPFSPVKDPPYVPDHHFPAALGHVGYGREKERSPFSSDKDPPYVPDHHFPASSRHESPLYSNYECSDGTTLFKSPSPLGAQLMEFKGKEEPDRVSNVETGVGLRSDVQKKRISAFSRLNTLTKDPAQEENEYVGSTKEDSDVSVDELMEMLCQRQRHWRGSTIKSQENIKRKAVDNSSKSKNTPSECDGDVMVIEEFQVNFKRRSKISKMKEESESLSSMSSVPRRRKLLRPKIEPKSGSSEASVEGNGERSVQSMGVVAEGENNSGSVVLPVSFEQNSDKKPEICPDKDVTERDESQTVTKKPEISLDNVGDKKPEICEGKEKGDKRNEFQNCDKKPEISSDKEGDKKAEICEGESSSKGDKSNENECDNVEAVGQNSDVKAKVEAAIRELHGIKDMSVNGQAKTQEAVQ